MAHWVLFCVWRAAAAGASLMAPTLESHLLVNLCQTKIRIDLPDPVLPRSKQRATLSAEGHKFFIFSFFNKKYFFGLLGMGKAALRIAGGALYAQSFWCCSGSQSFPFHLQGAR
jgi:hypothetical protein